jgi:hypothetical protein
MPPAAAAALDDDTAPPFDPYHEWKAMPAFTSRNLHSAYKVVVHFTSDAHADEFFKLINRPRRRVLWWPEPDGHKDGSIKFAYVAVDPAKAA